MSTETEQKPRVDLLLNELVEKTRAGKLRWQDTAAENTFLAAVRGLYTYEVSSNDQGSVQVLRVRDDKGRVVVKVVRGGDPLIDELHSLARNVALGTDERIEEALDVLRGL